MTIEAAARIDESRANIWASPSEGVRTKRARPVRHLRFARQRLPGAGVAGDGSVLQIRAALADERALI